MSSQSIETKQALENIASNIPVLIEFAPGTMLQSSPSENYDFVGTTHKALLTSVTSSDGNKTAFIPSDQIVLLENDRMGLGGMSFEGLDQECLVFWRVRDLLPEELIGHEATDKVLIDSSLVKRLSIHGAQVWPIRT